MLPAWFGSYRKQGMAECRPRDFGPFDLDDMDMNITWRVYVEPATNVGPDDNELLYDRAIYFGPYFTE